MGKILLCPACGYRIDTAKRKMTQFGKMIYMHRKRLKMSGEQLARKLHCTRSYISRIENLRDIQLPSYQIAFGLSKVFNDQQIVEFWLKNKLTRYHDV